MYLLNKEMMTRGAIYDFDIRIFDHKGEEKNSDATKKKKKESSNQSNLFKIELFQTKAFSPFHLKIDKRDFGQHMDLKLKEEKKKKKKKSKKNGEEGEKEIKEKSFSLLDSSRE